MKVTIENNMTEYVLIKINSVRICFDDNTEVKLTQIDNYELDLDSVDSSSISLSNSYCHNLKILNRFTEKQRNHVIYVRIDALVCEPTGLGEANAHYDIPCDMAITKIRQYGDNDTFGYMSIKLEGIVK